MVIVVALLPVADKQSASNSFRNNSSSELFILQDSARAATTVSLVCLFIRLFH